MKRKTKIAVALAAVLAAMTGLAAYMNIDRLPDILSAATSQNAIILVGMAIGLVIAALVIYKIAAAGEIKLNWWIFGKTVGRDRLMDRDRAREISRKVLEKEYMLDTQLAQMHRRELSLVCDDVIDTEKGRKPFALFVWTSLPFAGRKHELARMIEEHFDEVFIVEVNLATGYPAVSGRDQAETKDWLVKKHILSKPKEEDAFTQGLKAKMAEGLGIGMGESLAAATPKEEKEEGK